MKKFLWFLALVAALLLAAVPVLADDNFYVIAVPRPTIVVGVDIPITSLPYTIHQPGYYYLIGNLSYSGTGNGITVACDNVTIDLKGFGITGPGSGTGINLYDGAKGHQNLEVSNGSLSGWSDGLSDYNNSVGTSTSSRAINLQVNNCSNSAITLNGGGSLVTGCTVVGGGINFEGVATGNTVSNCDWGIAGGGTISGNAISNCNYGISGSGTFSGNNVSNCSVGIVFSYGSGNISGNTVVTTASGQTGLQMMSYEPCLVANNTVSGSGTHFASGTSTPIVATNYRVYVYGNTGF